MFDLVWISYRLQIKYHSLFEDMSNAADNVGQNKSVNKDFKTFMTKQMLEKVMSFTASFLYILQDYSNINGFCLTDNPCECYFGKLKMQCGTD